MVERNLLFHLGPTLRTGSLSLTISNDSEVVIAVLLSLTNYITLKRFYSQTWANDLLRIATCLQRTLFWGPNQTFYNKNNLRATTTCQQQPLFLDPDGGRCTQVWLYLWNLVLVDNKKLYFMFFKRNCKEKIDGSRLSLHHSTKDPKLVEVLVKKATCSGAFFAWKAVVNFINILRAALRQYSFAK